MGHKYNAKATICNAGHAHPSKREAIRCNELHLSQRVGAISDLETQVQFYFEINGQPLKHDGGRRAGVKLDWCYLENGKRVCEDTKGMVVRDWPLRKALFKALFPDIDLREV